MLVGTVKRYLKMQAYPLYITVGLGCAACVFHLGRLAFANPDTHLFKKYRMAGMPDDERDLKRGESFYNHSIRRYVQNKEIGIFPNNLLVQETTMSEGLYVLHDISVKNRRSRDITARLTRKLAIVARSFAEFHCLSQQRDISIPTEFYIAQKKELLI